LSITSGKPILNFATESGTTQYAGKLIYKIVPGKDDTYLYCFGVGR